MNHHRWLAVALSAALVWPFLTVRDSHAIAAFARQHKTECSTCHEPYPHRNEFGEAFRKNGYVWPGEAPAKKPDLDEALWISGIFESVPLAVTLRQTLDYDSERNNENLDPSTEVQLQAGGAIRNRVGYFAHDLTGSGEVFGLFRRVLDTPVNVKYGDIIPQTTLWKTNQNFTSAALATQTFSVAGEPALGSNRQALELNAILRSRFFAAAGIADRGNQNDMEFYGHLSYKIAGTDFLGNEPDLDLDVESVWDYLTITLGTYGYLGRTESIHNSYYRVGLETEAKYKGYTLLLCSLFANDDDADGNGLNVDSVVYLGELAYYFSSKYLLSARYEYEDVGNSVDGINRRVIAGFTWNPIQNLLFRLEGNHVNADGDDDSENTTGSLLVSYHL
jgi:hypothetical protein